jgi:hypothetical protein
LVGGVAEKRFGLSQERVRVEDVLVAVGGIRVFRQTRPGSKAEDGDEAGEAWLPVVRRAEAPPRFSPGRS